MTYTCPICEKASKEVSGHDVWARECGFYELMRPSAFGLDVYAACSHTCAAAMLVRVASRHKEIIPAGTVSKTWKCERCKKALPMNPHQDPNAKLHCVPSSVPQLVYPHSSENHCFCSDACLLGHLRDESIVALTA